MSQSKPATPDPERIGRYERIKRLGAGAMGTVILARDPDLGRLVAIKTIRREMLDLAGANADDILTRFKVEAKTAAQLKHPNILTIYEIGDGEGFSYIAMEYIEGTGLDRILAEEGAIRVDRAANLVAQVADALAFAHKKGVVHRDIKPANIMVEEGDRVKVTDFGIAKAMESGDDLTKTGSILGTPSYMSPEQARDSSKIDGRSDLFSLGCVFYELLAGKKAFRGDSITNVLFKVITEDPPPITGINPGVPEEAIGIVARAMAKSPETRYQSAEDLANDLRALAHPGLAPTVRTSDANQPTISLDPTAQEVQGIRTLATPATFATPPTIASTPTRVSGTPPPIPPPLPAAARPPAAPSPAPSAPRPAAARAARPAARPERTGGGKVLAFAGGAALVLLVAVGAWWILGRNATPSPSPEATPETQAAVEPGAPLESDTGAASPSIPGPAEATPAVSARAATPEPPAVRATPPPAETTGATARPPAAGSRSTTPPDTTPAATASADPAPPRDAFLDQVPNDDSPDGRALAAELSQGFSSGGGNSSFGTSRNLRRRTVIPPHSAAEQPAVRTLAWILTAEKSHFRRTGRFGSLSDIVGARDLPLDQAATGEGFERRGYRFTVRSTGEGFRADAHPLIPEGRAFYVDEAGYVLADD